jgi:hypothetical protein
MTLQQTIEIPADRRVYFDFLAPQEIPTGAAKIEFTITPFRAPRPDNARMAEQEEWVNPLLGLCEGSSFTVEKFLEMKREEIALEEANDERLWGKQ